MSTKEVKAAYSEHLGVWRFLILLTQHSKEKTPHP